MAAPIPASLPSVPSVAEVVPWAHLRQEAAAAADAYVHDLVTQPITEQERQDYSALGVVPRDEIPFLRNWACGVREALIDGDKEDLLEKAKGVWLRRYELFVREQCPEWKSCSPGYMDVLRNDAFFMYTSRLDPDRLRVVSIEILERMAILWTRITARMPIVPFIHPLLALLPSSHLDVLKETLSKPTTNDADIITRQFCREVLLEHKKERWTQIVYWNHPDLRVVVREALGGVEVLADLVGSYLFWGVQCKDGSA